MTSRNARAIDKLCAALRTQRPGITLGTLRQGSGSDSDHHAWVKDSRGVGVVRAVDIMTRDGDRLAANLAAKLGKHPAMTSGAYVIWKQRIISANRLGEGWRPMEDRGSPTQNHMDHVHVSVALAQAGYDYAGGWGALFSGSGTGAAPLPAGPPAGPTLNDPNGPHNGAPGAAAGLQGGLQSVAGPGIPGVDVDPQKIALTGAALGLGVVLIALGSARIVKPHSDRLVGDIQGAALAATTKGKAS